jgi:hypothetical protein
MSDTGGRRSMLGLAARSKRADFGRELYLECAELAREHYARLVERKAPPAERPAAPGATDDAGVRGCKRLSGRRSRVRPPR